MNACTAMFLPSGTAAILPKRSTFPVAVPFPVHLAMLMLRNRGFGFGEKLLLKALVHHFTDNEHLASYQSLYHHRPQLPSFIDYLRHPSSDYPIVPGVFCNCALCTPVGSLREASELVTHDRYMAEWKYDGIRVQIHCVNGNVTLFGRSGEVGSGSSNHSSVFLLCSQSSRGFSLPTRR